MTPPDPAELRRLCRTLGIAEEDLEDAVVLAADLLHVEELAGGGSNALAAARVLDVRESLARAATRIGGEAGLAALRERRRRDGRVPHTGPRDAEAIAEGVLTGLQVAAAVRRLTRGDA